MTTPAPEIVNWFEISAMLAMNIKQEVFNGIPHGIMSNADRSCVSGALIVDPQRPPARIGSTLYFNATDGVKRCLSRAVEAGAKVIQPWTSIGPMGALALISDLDGNVIGLHEEAQA